MGLNSFSMVYVYRIISVYFIIGDRSLMSLFLNSVLLSSSSSPLYYYCYYYYIKDKEKIIVLTTSVAEKTEGNELSRSLMDITTCTYLVRCGIFGVWHARCLMTLRYIKHANSVRWLLFYFLVLLATPLGV